MWADVEIVMMLPVLQPILLAMYCWSRCSWYMLAGQPKNTALEEYCSPLFDFLPSKSQLLFLGGFPAQALNKGAWWYLVRRIKPTS